jgi:vitamin B12 transporter
MKKKIFIVAAVFFSSQLQAQEDTTGKLLDEVLLTSNKYPKKQSETGKVVTVINRQQLDHSIGKTLGELLNTAAGITVIGANNNLGTNQTVNIRGASAGNTLILIDGIPLNDPSVNNNYFDINFFPLDQVERIEILKGGQSTLYGSDAVAGVINIILRKTVAKSFSVTGNLAGGSYNTFRENIGFNGKNKRVTYSAGYTHLGSEGFSAAYDKNRTGDFDKDAYHQHAVNGRLIISLNKNMQVYFSGTYSYYKADLDAAAYTEEKDYTVKNDNAQGTAGLIYNHRKGSLHLNYNFNYVERDYYDDSLFKSNSFVDWAKSRYIGRTHYAELYNNWKWVYWELLAGVDFRYNNTDQFYISQSPPFPPFSTSPSIYETSIRGKNMNQVSPYASVVYKDKKGFTTEFGGRWNHHSEYGSNFTFSINPSYLLKNKVKLFANLYSSFKTPTLYQLFDPSAGNTELDPEKGIIGEAGTEIFACRSFRARLVGFYRHTKDAIVYTFNPSTFAAKYINVSKQDNYGAELEANYTLNKWNIAANYTYTDGKTKSSFDGTGMPIGKDTTYYNLYRIPINAFNLTIGWQAATQLFISSMLQVVSKREEFIYGAAPETLKSYATIDLYGEYKFNRKIKVFLDLKNITNRTYFDIAGYNSRKFNFMTGISFNL